MRGLIRPGLTLLAAALTSAAALAQGQPAPAPAAPTGTAATVNGEAIPETAVHRGVARVPANKYAEARQRHLEFLIDNTLVDQYLVQLKIDADKKEVDTRLAQILEDIKKQGQAVEKVFKELSLTEAELRAHIESDARWEKFCNQQATEAELQKFFDSNKEAFDGSQVRVRHILLSPGSADPQAGEQLKAQLLLIRKQVEEAAAAAIAKLPASADALAREKARTEALDQAFATAAREKSACPSKDKGGDTGWFPRAGDMVEPFARAAFALKPYQMSDVVKTPWGYHLLLAIDSRPGRDVKFEEVKADVKELYCDRLREAVVAYMRPRAKITIAPAPKMGQ
jgi:parvulin-like peptidyl-prolyl isomerase